MRREELWLCSTEYGPVLASEDITQADHSVTCRKVLPDEYVKLGRFAYRRVVRYLLEALVP